MKPIMVPLSVLPVSTMAAPATSKAISVSGTVWMPATARMPSTITASPAMPCTPADPDATSEASMRSIGLRVWKRVSNDRDVRSCQTAEALTTSAAPNAIAATAVRIVAYTPSSASTPSTMPATPTKKQADRPPPLLAALASAGAASTTANSLSIAPPWINSAAPNTIVEIDTSASGLTPERPMTASTIAAIPPRASTKPPYEAASAGAEDVEEYVMDIDDLHQTLQTACAGCERNQPWETWGSEFQARPFARAPALRIQIT